jgi:hypothetical protein
MMNLARRSLRRRIMNMETMRWQCGAAAEHVPTTSTTVMEGPSLTPTMTNQDQGEAAVDGEVASRREPPW